MPEETAQPFDPKSLAYMLSVGGTSQPNVPPPSNQPPPAAPDLGSGTADAPAPKGIGPGTLLGEPVQQTPKPAQPPKPGGMPLLAQFLGQMISPPKGTIDPALTQPSRPASRLDAFEHFIGQFLTSFSQGMSAAGTGPAANARGFGAAVQAPFQQQMQQYQLGQQQQAQQSQIGLQQAEAERQRAQAQMTTVTLPNGQVAQLPAEMAKSLFQAQIQAQGRVQAAGTQKQFLSTPFGIYDTKTQKYVGGEGGMKGVVTVTPEMQQEMKLPQEMVGKQAKLTDLSSWMRGEASTITAVQGAKGPALGSKLQGPGSFKDLGLGSPAENAIARAKLQIQQNQFDRDTFGTLYGKAIPSSLIDDQGNALGWKSPAAPTSSIKTQAQQASDLSQLFGKVRAKLAEANKAGKLGPTSGRVNEFMTGTIGADDPMFSEVRALGSLTASGMLKAHFGARGGQQMYDHFEALFNTGKMTYGDLDAAMKGFQLFMDQYASRVKTAGSGGGGAGGTKLSPNNPFAPGK